MVRHFMGNSHTGYDHTHCHVIVLNISLQPHRYDVWMLTSFISYRSLHASFGHVIGFRNIYITYILHLFCCNCDHNSFFVSAHAKWLANWYMSTVPPVTKVLFFWSSETTFARLVWARNEASFRRKKSATHVLCCWLCLLSANPQHKWVFPLLLEMWQKLRMKIL